MTDRSSYAHRLVAIQTARWKLLLNVQAPYRWNLRRIEPGMVLDIGCGIGRSLLDLDGGIGIDHNEESIRIARERGLNAFTPVTFEQSEFNLQNHYDSLLLAHVAEHLGESATTDLIKKYLPLLKPGGKLIMITPQEAGYRSDVTHIQLTDFKVLNNIVDALGFHQLKAYSFPFPRFVGKFFLYNEFVSVSQKPESSY